MKPPLRKHAFSLVEVILALGILTLSVLALVGLLAPTLDAIRSVSESDERDSVISYVNAVLQNDYDVNHPNSGNNLIAQSIEGIPYEDAQGNTGMVTYMSGGFQVFYYFLSREIRGDGTMGKVFPIFIAANDYNSSTALESIEGSLFAVVFQQADDPDYVYSSANMQQESIIPVFVTVLRLDPTIAGANTVQPSGTPARVDWTTDAFDETAKLIEFTTAKLR